MRRILLIWIQGFDEFLNLVIDDAVEVGKSARPARRRLAGRLVISNVPIPKHSVKIVLILVTGQILLKGDNVALIQGLTN